MSSIFAQELSTRPAEVEPEGGCGPGACKARGISNPPNDAPRNKRARELEVIQKSRAAPGPRRPAKRHWADVGASAQRAHLPGCSTEGVLT
jgi:hypothetical protein